MIEQRNGAHVFVKVDEYKEIMDVLEMIKDKLNEIRNILGNINSLRDEEDAELTMWNSAINDIEEKIDNIDRMMFEPEQT